jgi:hypothetical protein
LYILTKNCTFYMYDYCKTTLLLYVLTISCKLPEDCNFAEKCGSKLILKYTKYIIVLLLVLIEFVIHFTMHVMKKTEGVFIIRLYVSSESRPAHLYNKPV